MKYIGNCFWVIIFWMISIDSSQAQNLDNWFSVNEVAKNVWAINDRLTVNVYVVEGADSALVIDTGLGVADLSSYIKTITQKPLIIVNTHGHPDHVGANYQFEKVYAHPTDFSGIEYFSSDEQRANMVHNMVNGAAPSDVLAYNGAVYNTKLLPVHEGYVFNLGGRSLKVLETPGHTPGGICLLDIENKMIFTGDNNNELVWLFLPGCSPLSDYLKTLEKQKSLFNDVKIIMPGHGAPMETNFINDQIECVRRILSGECESIPYESFAGKGMICTYGKARVAYNPDNLR